MHTSEQLSALQERIMAQVRRSVPPQHHALFDSMRLQQTSDDELLCVFPERHLALVKGFYNKDLAAVMRRCTPGINYRLSSEQSPKTVLAPFFPGCTFDTFVPSGINLYAMHAAQEVANQLEDHSSNNLLMLYGDCGVGKTHLLHAIGHAVQAKAKKVRYEPAYSFLQAVIEVARSKDPRLIDSFRARYMDLDVLLLDDLHFLNGNKARTQEELLRIHDHLVEGFRGTVVYTSGQKLEDLTQFNPALLSRLRRGLMLPLTSPEPTAVRTVLMRKVAARKNDPLCTCDWPKECLDYLADAIRDMRELEGCLHQILSQAQAQGVQQISLSLVQAAVAQRLHIRKRPSPKQVIETVAKHYNLEYGDLLTQSRKRNLVFGRHVAMYLCRKLLDCSYPEIGTLFGGKDHSTAMHACKRIEKELEQRNMELIQALTTVKSQLNSQVNS